jgi:hypothetical protein
MVLLAALGGCVSTGDGPYMGGPQSAAPPTGIGCTAHAPPSVPGVQGPYGQPVAMAAPYSYAPPSGKEAAMAMISTSVPLDLIQQAKLTGSAGSGIMQTQGLVPGALPPPGGIAPPGVPVVPGGPGGIMQAGGPPGAVAAIGALTGGGAAGGQFAAARTEIRFAGPSGMKITWYAPTPDGKGGFSPTGIEAPGRYNFAQAAIYRLKLSNIPRHPAVDLYPTLEVVPVNNKTATFLAHSAVPVNFTEEDFEQVAAGNYVVKVIYLPDPANQDLAAVGADEVVSSRLDPGVDPIAEACKRGSILAVVRIGNINLELPGTPPMDAPPTGYMQHGMAPRMRGPGMAGGPMVPYGIGLPGRATTGPGMPPTQLPPMQNMTPGAMAPQQPSAPGTPVTKLPEAGTVQPTSAKKWW